MVPVRKPWCRPVWSVGQEHAPGRVHLGASAPPASLSGWLFPLFTHQSQRHFLPGTFSKYLAHSGHHHTLPNRPVLIPRTAMSTSLWRPLTVCLSACARTVTPLGCPFTRSSPALEGGLACSKGSLHVCQLKNNARVNILTLLDSVGCVCTCCLSKKVINPWDIFRPRTTRSFGVYGQGLANPYSRDVQLF